MRTKRLIVRGIVAVTAFATVFGLAASLNVSGGDLGAGSDTVAACDPDGVTASYTVAYDSGIPGYGVSGVQVTGIDNNCMGQQLSVTLTDNGGNQLASSSTTVSGATQAVTFSPSVSASAIEGIHVVIAE